MSEPAKPSGPSQQVQRRAPVSSARPFAVAGRPAPVPEPLPHREMETIARELGVRRQRIASSPGVLAGPPLVPDASVLERLEQVWRFDQPPSAWSREAHDA